MSQILLLPDVFPTQPLYPPIFCRCSKDEPKTHANSYYRHTETHTNAHAHPHTHLSWRRWVLPAARWGWLGSLHPPQPEEALSAGGQSGCVGGGALPRCGCQPRGELLNTDKQRHAQEQMSDVKTYCDLNNSAVREGLAASDLYLQKERRGSDGPHLGAGRRKGAPNSSYTGLPARHTHKALQSSKTHREEREAHRESSIRRNLRCSPVWVCSRRSPDSTVILHTNKLQLRQSARQLLFHS